MNAHTENTERQDNLRMLRESAQSFALKESPLTRARALRGSASGFDRAFWQQLAEQGWTGLLVPESADGYGQGFAEMAAVITALATQVAPEPIVPALVFASRLIQHCGDDELPMRLLSQIAAGDLIPAVAWQESVASPRLHLAARHTTARQENGKFLLNGEKHHVRPGADCDGYLVSAVDAAGEQSIFWIPADATGITLTAMPLADGSNAARVNFKHVVLDMNYRLAHGNKALQALTRAYDEALIMSSVELLALQRAMLTMTLEYLRTRKQFGKPIGSFQALQHRAVDLHIQQELTAAALDQAIELLDSEATEAERSTMASRVKARAADAGLLIAREAVQLHGAIGFTDEYDLGLYLQRALVLSAWLGNAQTQRHRYAALTRPANI
jgi:alkylation response protein AidB-like acyl-CoA dehydrogenase